MSEENTSTAADNSARTHDEAPAASLAEFMKTGWSDTDLPNLAPLEVVTYAFSRREIL